LGFICRVDSNGAFAAEFGNAGCVKAPVVDGPVDGVVAVGDDVLGYGVTDDETGVRAGTIWRLRASGVREPSFGDDGRVRIASTGAGTFISHVVIEPSGTLLAVGFAGEFSILSGEGKALVVRLSPQGEILQQTTFAVAGQSITLASHVTALADGRVVVAGYYLGADDYRHGYLATFDAGVAHTPSIVLLGLSGNAQVTPTLDLLVQSEKVVGRFNLDGTVVTGFGGGDGVIRSGDELYESWRCALALPGGELVVAGTSSIMTAGQDHIPDQPLLRRFDATGAPVSDFGDEGRHLIRMQGPGRVTQMVASDDGSVLVLGVQTDADQLRMWPFVARLR
jgi:hypothetical protein